MFASLLKKRTLVIVGVLFTFFAFAQDNKFEKYTVSGTYLQKGMEHYGVEEYDSAIVQFNLIHENDTNYSAALADKAASYISLEKFDKAIEVVKEALDKNYPDRDLHYINYAVALRNQKKYDEALAVIEKGLKEYPFSEKLHYNNILITDKAERYDDCADFLKSSLKSSYMYDTYHLKAGLLALEEGDITMAMMALGTYMVLNPGSSTANALLYQLNEEVTSKQEHEPKGFKFTKDGDDYSDIDLLINNYLANSKKYKVPLKSSIPLQKQYHLMMSKLSYDAGDDGFFMQYYVPIYKAIWDEDKFELFANYLFASSKNENHLAIVAKKKTELIEFRGWFLNQFHDRYRNQKVTVDGVDLTSDVWFNNSGVVTAIGKEDEATENLIGQFYFFHQSGALGSKGKFGASGKKEGEWKWFYENGQLKEVAVFNSEGELNGVNKEYESNGNLSYEINYKDGKASGLAKYYTILGAKASEINFTEGKRDGKTTYYYVIGTPKYHLNYKDGELEGNFEYFHPNGKLREKGQFKEGNRSGAFESYFSSGKLDAKYVYNEEGDYHGDYEEYFYNGQLYKKGKYVKGSESGAWEQFNKNGTISRKFLFDESGKLNGKIEEYDVDGKLYAVKNYKKGGIYSYQFFDRSGAVIYESKAKGKKLHYVEYSADKIKVAEGDYLDNRKDGEWKFFHDNGELKTVESFKEGDLEGPYRTYYSSGQLKKVYKFEEDEIESNYLAYYNNGQLEEEGFYKDGNLAGEWVNYHANGKLASKSYFIDGEKTGREYVYDIAGDLQEVRIQEENEFVGFEQYSPKGVLYNDVKIINANGECQYKYSDGSKYSTLNYVYGTAHGEFTWYFPNGTVNAKGKYYNGQKVGDWKWYYYNGQVSQEGKYIDGEREGEWLEYNMEGGISERYHYENGQLEGLYTYYYASGKKSREDEYYLGNRHGKTTFYDESGAVDHFRYNSEGKIISFSYLGKDGKETVKQNLVGQTANVVAYYQNGNVSRKYQLVKGMFEGEYIRYFPDGKIRSKDYYKNNEDEGKSFVYYNNGQIRSTETNVFGRREGVKEVFYEDGTVKQKSTYVSGKLHGPRTFYNPDGSLKAKLEYLDGDVVKIEKR